MTRFVILRHDHPTVHWDLMLECGNVLRTWRMPRVPDDAEMPLEEIADHRLAYLDYEGPVSGNRGTVERYDRGTYQLVDAGDDHLEFAMHGKIVRGVMRLERVDQVAWKMRLKSGES